MLSEFLLIIAAQAAPAAAADAAASLVEPDPKAMSRSEIRAFNAKLARNHPFYIRCVKSEPIGSLVKRDVSCRTNEQWDKADRNGNDGARETYEAYRPRGNPGAGS